MTDRHMLMAELVGKVSGICRGFSMPDDANHAMRHICDALIDYEIERAKSFDAEEGAFASTFAVYAEEARTKAADIAKARERWEVSNAPALFQSVEHLLGHLIDATSGLQREHVYAADRALGNAHRVTINFTKRGAGSAQQAPASI